MEENYNSQKLGIQFGLNIPTLKSSSSLSKHKNRVTEQLCPLPERVYLKEFSNLQQLGS